ncbi:Heparanase-like protein, partial [Thalictrum thalictroides]
AIVTFGLNALYGRHKIKGLAWGGAWDSSNAYEFIKYTVSKGYHIDSWEFGNDPNLVNKILDPHYLSKTTSNTFKKLRQTIKIHGPWASAWVGESGGAYNSVLFFGIVLLAKESLLLRAKHHQIYSFMPIVQNQERALQYSLCRHDEKWSSAAKFADAAVDVADGVATLIVCRCCCPGS